MTGTVYVRTVPHPIPKEYGVTQSLGRSKIIGVKATVTGGKLDGHLQLRHWCRAQPSSTNLGCKFCGSWSDRRTPLHCTGLSMFWFHKLSSEPVTRPPSPGAGRVYVYSQLRLPGKARAVPARLLLSHGSMEVTWRAPPPIISLQPLPDGTLPPNVRFYLAVPTDSEAVPIHS